ncbi:hypothetical protein GCM10025857_31610 [Alicyclobacillus contaminans]|uniref:helix-turn-helix domain-containing protein n=1 Tax=Alicyclobacillus contaminans TaxID=392016 RepID=UPI00054E8C78|nr:hypothetical protein GCM10025857_31610 [Alicyclobacillus contaminans]
MFRFELGRLLKEQGISQSELSAISGVRRARINQICNEKNVSRVEMWHIDAICNALGVEPWHWIKWEPDEE